MNKLLILIVSVLLMVGLTACKKANKATIYNDKSEVLKVLDDSKSIAEIVDAWEAKERVLEKIMPLFEYQIEMEVDGEKQMWRFNKGGYLMKDGESIVYKTPKSEAFARYLD